MKKIVSLLFVIVLLAVCALSVNAAGITAEEQKIITALSQEITTKTGNKITLEDKYINLAEDYLTKADMSDADAKKIVESIEAAATVIKESSAVTLASADETVKHEVIEHAQDAADVINAKVSVKKDAATSQYGYVAKITFNKDSAVEGYKAGSNITIDFAKSSIKQTGAEGNMTVAIVTAVAVITAVGFVFISSTKKATAK